MTGGSGADGFPSGNNPGFDFGDGFNNGNDGNGGGDNGFPADFGGGGGSNGLTDESNTIDTGLNPDDVNCDKQGTCYDVSVHCKDTRIVVNVGTNKPFSGRIYALGRSETCNVDVINSDTFRLDLTMAGQDCNTQSAVREAIPYIKYRMNQSGWLSVL